MRHLQTSPNTLGRARTALSAPSPHRAAAATSHRSRSITVGAATRRRRTCATRDDVCSRRAMREGSFQQAWASVRLGVISIDPPATGPSKTMPRRVPPGWLETTVQVQQPAPGEGINGFIPAPDHARPIKNLNGRPTRTPRGDGNPAFFLDIQGYWRRVDTIADLDFDNLCSRTHGHIRRSILSQPEANVFFKNMPNWVYEATALAAKVRKPPLASDAALETGVRFGCRYADTTTTSDVEGAYDVPSVSSQRGTCQRAPSQPTGETAVALSAGQTTLLKSSSSPSDFMASAIRWSTISVK